MKPFLILFILFWGNIAAAQELNGIGEIKIGISKKDLISKLQIEKKYFLPAEKGIKPKDDEEQLIDNQEFSKKISLSNDVLLVHVDSSINSFYRWPGLSSAYNAFFLRNLKGVSCYFLNGYKFDGISFDFLNLVFENDTLVYFEFELKNDNLIDSMMNKYPNFVVKHKEDTLHCQNETNPSILSLRRSIELKNSSIKVVYSRSDNFNASCKPTVKIKYVFFVSNLFYSKISDFINKKKIVYNLKLFKFKTRRTNISPTILLLS